MTPLSATRERSLVISDFAIKLMASKHSHRRCSWADIWRKTGNYRKEGRQRNREEEEALQVEGAAIAQSPGTVGTWTSEELRAAWVAEACYKVTTIGCGYRNQTVDVPVVTLRILVWILRPLRIMVNLLWAPSVYVCVYVCVWRSDFQFEKHDCG